MAFPTFSSWKRSGQSRWRLAQPEDPQNNFSGYLANAIVVLAEFGVEAQKVGSYSIKHRLDCFFGIRAFKATVDSVENVRSYCIPGSRSTVPIMLMIGHPTVHLIHGKVCEHRAGRGTWRNGPSLTDGIDLS